MEELEGERPGIGDRVWDWVRDKDNYDYDNRPYNGRITNINLGYFGIGDEYPLNYLKKYPEELDSSKKNHPEAFENYMGEGTGDPDKINLRKDLNLILYVYQDDIEDIETFSIITTW